MGIWDLEPWQQFAIVFGGGLLMLALGVAPLIQRWRGVGPDGPGHLFSSVLMVVIGLATIVRAFFL